jgi:ABC-type enterobactin transport system permease subunit
MDRVVLVIVSLTVVALVCLGGVIYLAAQQLGVPDVLVATTGAAVGALGSLLVAANRPT